MFSNHPVLFNSSLLFRIYTYIYFYDETGSTLLEMQLGMQLYTLAIGMSCFVVAMLL